MATTKAPLFGLDASGSLAKSIVFSKWKGRTYVRRHAIPANPKSGLQVGMRSSMKFITQDYVNLSAGNKAQWALKAKADDITPMNAQVRFGQRNIRINKGVIHDPTDAAATTPTAVATFTATAVPKGVVLAWTQPSVTPGQYATMIWMSKTTGFTPDASTLILLVAHTILTATITHLTTGVPYYFRIAETNFDGTIGALIAQATATPT